MNQESKVEVTVIIPYFNGSSHIVAALESLERQSFRNFETIVVDDGSSSTELRKLLKFRAKYKFTVLSQSNLGQSAARNLGIANSTGNYICFLDQDDFFYPNHVELLLKETNSAAEFIFSSYRREDSFGDLVGRTSSTGIISANKFTLNRLLKRNVMRVPTSFMVRAESLRLLNGFDTRLRGYEDDDLIIRAFQEGLKFAETHETTCVWTKTPGSASIGENMIRSQRIFYLKWISRNHSISIRNKIHLHRRFARIEIVNFLRALATRENSSAVVSSALRDFICQSMRKSPVSSALTLEIYIVALISILPRFAIGLGSRLYPSITSKIIPAKYRSQIEEPA